MLSFFITTPVALSLPCLSLKKKKKDSVTAQMHGYTLALRHCAEVHTGWLLSHNGMRYDCVVNDIQDTERVVSGLCFWPEIKYFFVRSRLLHKTKKYFFLFRNLWFSAVENKVNSTNARSLGVFFFQRQILFLYLPLIVCLILIDLHFLPQFGLPTSIKHQVIKLLWNNWMCFLLILSVLIKAVTIIS